MQFCNLGDAYVSGTNQELLQDYSNKFLKENFVVDTPQNIEETNYTEETQTQETSSLCNCNKNNKDNYIIILLIILIIIILNKN